MSFSEKKQTLIFTVITLLWFVVTTVSALLYSHNFLPASWREIFSPVFHPQWATATVFIMIPLQWFWIRKLVGDEKVIKEQSARRYLMIFLLIAATLTGFAANMGFLPFFFHELCVWPLVILAIWDFVKSVRGE